MVCFWHFSTWTVGGFFMGIFSGFSRWSKQNSDEIMAFWRLQIKRLSLNTVSNCYFRSQFTIFNQQLHTITKHLHSSNATGAVRQPDFCANSRKLPPTCGPFNTPGPIEKEKIWPKKNSNVHKKGRDSRRCAFFSQLKSANISTYKRLTWKATRVTATCLRRPHLSTYFAHRFPPTTGAQIDFQSSKATRPSKIAKIHTLPDAHWARLSEYQHIFAAVFLPATQIQEKPQYSTHVQLVRDDQHKFHHLRQCQSTDWKLPKTCPMCSSEITIYK